MIRTDAEYQEAVRRLREERVRIGEQKIRLKDTGLTPAQVKRAQEPLESFRQQLAEEVEDYERLKRGDIETLQNLHGMERTLVALRIASGMTQRALAEALDVDESQVSRDERNEYHGITVARAARIMDALNVEFRSTASVRKRSRSNSGRSAAVAGA